MEVCRGRRQSHAEDEGALCRRRKFTVQDARVSLFLGYITDFQYFKIIKFLNLLAEQSWLHYGDATLNIEELWTKPPNTGQSSRISRERALLRQKQSSDAWRKGRRSSQSSVSQYQLFYSHTETNDIDLMYTTSRRASKCDQGRRNEDDTQGLHA